MKFCKMITKAVLGAVIAFGMVNVETTRATDDQKVINSAILEKNDAKLWAALQKITKDKLETLLNSWYEAGDDVLNETAEKGGKKKPAEVLLNWGLAIDGFSITRPTAYAASIDPKEANRVHETVLNDLLTQLAAHIKSFGTNATDVIFNAPTKGGAGAGWNNGGGKPIDGERDHVVEAIVQVLHSTNN